MEAGFPVPDDVGTGDRLSPWAGAWRYDASGDPLDRAEALDTARAALAWARGRLRDPA